MSQPRREFLRYGITIALGLAVDLTAARTAVAFGLQLELAAIIGVAAGAVFNYILLELWAFAGPKNVTAVARPLRYLGALGITMAVRAGTVWILEEALRFQSRPLLILIAAAAVSFVVNFLLSKNWVFSRHDKPSEDEEDDIHA
ncbi:GtrA family protein [Ruegeria sp. ANG-R]|uniref:GtrA family protein n=1 Tax=Ruegeria sp. ANG-R TaxID=1577903 RepID=UPI00068DB00C|nr:GtrA family protein [Ruegeria sp. ANG-R]